jgi:hypothetical protein
MIKAIDLSKREVGPWANFESFLLKNEHVGWIEWQPGGTTFRIKKSPFSEHYSQYLYAVPDDVIIPEEGLIRIEVGELVKTVKLLRKKLYGFYSDKIYIVEGYEEIKTDSLPKPSISKDEFLSQVVHMWNGAEGYPLFKKEVAYNILSCQKDFFGIGGIGVESFVPGGSSQVMKYLKSSINKLLPDEFRKRNEKYEYDFIVKKDDARVVNNRRNDPKSNEISFNDMSKLSDEMSLESIPIQIPLILPEEVLYNPYHSNFYDRDVLDYQLSALLITPIIQSNLVEKFTDLAIKTSDYINKRYTEDTLLVDSLAHVKVACSACRLELKEKLTEDMLPRIKNELFEMFKDYADTYQDAMVRGGGPRWNIPIQDIPVRRNLTIEANKVYKKLLEMDRKNREIGISWISIENIRTLSNLKNFDDYVLQKALKELNNANLILQRKNYSEFMIVHYEK